MSSQLTAQQEAKLAKLAKRLRGVAVERGAHAVVWDGIFDIEAKLTRRGSALFHEEAEQTIDLAKRMLRGSQSSRRRHSACYDTSNR